MRAGGISRTTSRGPLRALQRPPLSPLPWERATEERVLSSGCQSRVPGQARVIAEATCQPWPWHWALSVLDPAKAWRRLARSGS